MSCEVEKRDGVLAIRGEMTIYGAAALKQDVFAALDGGTAACTLDLAAVSEFDTTGLQILLLAQRVCAARGATFRLANLSPSVRETLDLLQVQHIPIAVTEGAVT